jgi:hypothetical protein
MAKGSGGDTVIHYADYLETNHKALISTAWDLWDAVMSTPYDERPYSNWGDHLTDPAPAFFGIGYVMSDYPTMFDMFGKFMAGLDVETLNSQILQDALYGPVVEEAVSAAVAIIDSDINAHSYPRFEEGMADINAVMDSEFMMGRSFIEDGRNRGVAKYISDIHLHMIDVGQQRWVHHLQWNAQVISHYLSIFHTYFGEETQYNSTRYSLATAEHLWPFTVLGHVREFVAALNGAAAATSKRDSGFQRVMSGVLGVASLLTAPATGGTSLLAFGASQLLGGGGASGAGLMSGAGYAQGLGYGAGIGPGGVA